MSRDMDGVTAPSAATSWFLCLPSPSDTTRRQINLLNARSNLEARTELGIQWVVGNYPRRQFASLREGLAQSVVIGEGAASASSHLSALLSQPGEVPCVSMAPGNMFSLCRHGTTTRLRGTMTMSRTLYCATLGTGEPVFGDRPSVLAWLIGAAPCQSMAAWSLLSPGYTYQFSDRTHWRGVRVVPPGVEVIVHEGGAFEFRSWWKPPEKLPLVDSAPLIRRELELAVDARVGDSSQVPVSSDLSGGADSSSLTYLLAARAAGRPVHTLTVQPDDAGHDDAAWAKDAAQVAGTTHHTLFSPMDVPGPYDGSETLLERLAESDIHADGPVACLRGLARAQAIVALIAEIGADVHLGGYGADELFTLSAAHLHDQFRKSPVRAFRDAQRYGRLRRWRTLDVLREFSGGDSFAQWATLAASRIEIGSDAMPGRPQMGWGVVPRAPEWVTEHALASVRAIVDEAPLPEHPVADSRATHVSITALRTSAEMMRPMAYLERCYGVSLAMPFQDERVCHAALKADWSEQTPGRSYKAALRAAMEPYNTGATLTRNSKGEFTREVYDGINRNKRVLADLFTNSRLGGLGFVDEKTVRSSIRDNFRSDFETTALERTIGVEAWLRGLNV